MGRLHHVHHAPAHVALLLLFSRGDRARHSRNHHLEVFGTLPLYALDRLYRMFSGSLSRPELALVPDEVLRGDKKSDLRIASCRKRPLWKYPFTIKYGGAFFQFIGSRDTVLGARPHIYRLRRLPPGEIARGLREYDPDDILREPPRVAALL